MKKIISIKAIQLLVIDGIMLAFLTFKEGLTWERNSPNPRTSHPFLSHLSKPEKKLPPSLSSTNFILEYFMIDKKNQAGWAWSFLSIFRIKDNGNWSIIDQLNLHIRSKDTCLNGHFLC